MYQKLYSMQKWCENCSDKQKRKRTEKEETIKNYKKRIKWSFEAEKDDFNFSI